MYLHYWLIFVSMCLYNHPSICVSIHVLISRFFSKCFLPRNTTLRNKHMGLSRQCCENFHSVRYEGQFQHGSKHGVRISRKCMLWSAWKAIIHTVHGLNRDHQVRFINTGGIGLQTVYFEAGIYKSATGVVYEGQFKLLGWWYLFLPWVAWYSLPSSFLMQCWSRFDKDV